LLEGKDTSGLGVKLRFLSEQLTAPQISLAENAELDCQFHRMIVESAGNRKLLETYVRLDAQLQIVRIHNGSNNWRSRLPISRKEHSAIADAFSERNTDLARQLVHEHIRASLQRMVADINSSGVNMVFEATGSNG